MSRAGCPSIVRSDHGTENTLLAATHMSPRHGHVDDFKGGYRFGSSTTNTVSLNKSSREVLIIIPVFLWYILLSLFQRIESRWAQLRNSVTDWWINTFKVHNMQNYSQKFGGLMNSLHLKLYI